MNFSITGLHNSSNLFQHICPTSHVLTPLTAMFFGVVVMKICFIAYQYFTPQNSEIRTPAQLEALLTEAETYLISTRDMQIDDPSLNAQWRQLALHVLEMRLSLRIAQHPDLEQALSLQNRTLRPISTVGFKVRPTPWCS